MSEAIPEHMLEYVAERFRVLGDATRLAILRDLMHARERNVGELVAALGMSQANVSKHLRVLLDARIVSRRQSGTAAYYSVVDPTVVRMCDIVCDRLAEQAHREAELVARR
ncbi:MAG: ArsR family transcriptional regulator [Chloroflexi bacterium CFX7]|nr:MAG: ArsR family transcriptional regulator [bacterium]MCE7929506.1 ArsR family transcriptional regulator [Chloroflexi bacterium CFX7]MCK6563603.1 metalloregulator ArsR/SmtB family transcription factor [Dehalococcoidia bacterium]MCL4232582.1 winged helix-turn-helix domain-containing protein [Dehalococcoidia bacterium]